MNEQLLSKAKLEVYHGQKVRRSERRMDDTMTRFIREVCSFFFSFVGCCIVILLYYQVVQLYYY